MNKLWGAFLFFWLILQLQACCFFAQCDSEYYGNESNYSIGVIDTSNRILEISYQNSSLVKKYNAKKAEWHLSAANDSETVYIKSALGYDTLVYKIVATKISIDETKCCDKTTTEYSNPIILYCSNPSAFYQARTFYIR